MRRFPQTMTISSNVTGVNRARNGTERGTVQINLLTLDESVRAADIAKCEQKNGRPKTSGGRLNASCIRDFYIALMRRESPDNLRPVVLR